MVGTASPELDLGGKIGEKLELSCDRTGDGMCPGIRRVGGGGGGVPV